MSQSNSSSNNSYAFSSSGSIGTGIPYSTVYLTPTNPNSSIQVGSWSISSNGITFVNSIATRLSRDDFEDYYMIVYDLHAKETTRLTPSDLFSIYSKMCENKSHSVQFYNVKTFLTYLYKTLNEPDYKIEIQIIPR